MKTLLSLLLCFSFCIFSAHSQSWRIAPTMGLNVSAISYSNALRNNFASNILTTRMGVLARFQIGAYIDRAFSDRFSMRSGLLYTEKGGGLRMTTNPYGTIRSFRGSYKFSYLEIPLLLNIAVGSNDFWITGGPILGVTLNAKGGIDGQQIYGYGYFSGMITSFRIGTGITDEILPLEVSASLGLVKQLNVDDRPLEIGLHVQPSFTSWNTLSRTEPSYSARNLLVNLRVAYLFELRR